MKLSSAVPLLTASFLISPVVSTLFSFSKQEYYENAAALMADVDAGYFDALYIQYHGCVWSEYDAGEDGACGVDAGDDLWYMGWTQCFRANVAYSMYGIKAGEFDSGAATGACSRSNYIDSFFTVGGIESFGDNAAVTYADYGASSECSVTSYGQGNNNNMEHNSMFFEDFTSTTLACAANGRFIQASFEGMFCSGNKFAQNLGYARALNSELENLGCHQVYQGENVMMEDGENAQAYYDEENAADDGGDAVASVVDLLSYSVSCSHAEYSNRCPDPFHVKQSRDEKAVRSARSRMNRDVPLIMPILSALLFIGSIVLYCMANGVRDVAARREIETSSGVPTEPTTAEKMTVGIQRIGTDLSHRTRTFTEKLAEYAEEEDVIEEPSTSNYQAPEETAPMEEASSAVSAAPSVEGAVSVASVSDNAAAQGETVSIASAPSVSDKAVTQVEPEQKEIADAMLSEKGVTPKTSTSINPDTGKKYKRPRLAKLSKFLRSRKSKNKK